MRWKPVHQYQAMVMCPSCGRLYMPEGDACCWRCAPVALPTGDDLLRARLRRQAAEIADGTVGSLIGLGFAPASGVLPVWGPPPPAASLPDPFAAPPVYSKTTSVRRAPPAAAEWRFAMWLVAVAALALSAYLLWMGGAFGPRP